MPTRAGPFWSTLRGDDVAKSEEQGCDRGNESLGRSCSSGQCNLPSIPSTPSPSTPSTPAPSATPLRPLLQPLTLDSPLQSYPPLDKSTVSHKWHASYTLAQHAVQAATCSPLPSLAHSTLSELRTAVRWCYGNPYRRRQNDSYLSHPVYRFSHGSRHLTSPL